MFNIFVGRFPTFDSYPLPYSNAEQFTKSITSLEFGVLEESNTNTYRRIYQEVLDKYD